MVVKAFARMAVVRAYVVSGLSELVSIAVVTVVALSEV